MELNEFTNPFSDTRDYIYHYTSIETLIKYILPQKMLRLSPLNRTNDPEENRVHIRGTVNNIKKNMNMEHEAVKRAMQEISQKISSNVKILCFSQDDNYGISCIPFLNKGFAKPRMWAQYAQSHTGVCLVLKKSRVIEQFDTGFNKMIHFYKNITYKSIYEMTSQYPYAQELLLSEILNANIEQIIVDRINQNHEVYFFSKHKDWENENEFRLMVKTSENQEVFLGIDGLLEYIILGHKSENILIKPISILSNHFQEKPQLLKFGYNGSSYTINTLI